MGSLSYKGISLIFSRSGRAWSCRRSPTVCLLSAMLYLLHQQESHALTKGIHQFVLPDVPALLDAAHPRLDSCTSSKRKNIRHQKVIPDCEILAVALVKVQRFAPCAKFIPLRHFARVCLPNTHDTRFHTQPPISDIMSQSRSRPTIMIPRKGVILPVTNSYIWLQNGNSCGLRCCVGFR